MTAPAAPRASDPPRRLPLLFLDVDGPLIPFGAPPNTYPSYEPTPHPEPRPTPPSTPHPAAPSAPRPAPPSTPHPAARSAAPATPTASEGHPLLPRLDPGHGPRLAALPCTLIWATTWMADANTCIAPRLGLPPLEVMAWPAPPATAEPVTQALHEAQEAQEARDERLGLHWKTRALVARAAALPFIWVDDEITDPDRAWVAAHHQGPALLHRVDPRRGLTAADYTALADWLRAPSPQPSPWPPHWTPDPPPRSGPRSTGGRR
ncbi:hypothetical protein ABT084_14650 [Streptomyces sp. NPDC002138]|uniref:hypothetical protein n=1 Tax=Streptomyces sp. NPDC002138 TaxID=3154410 RepID=UPI00332FA302